MTAWAFSPTRTRCNLCSLWTASEYAARDALRDGQLRGMFKPGELRRFLNVSPAIWKVYFAGGGGPAGDGRALPARVLRVHGDGASPRAASGSWAAQNVGMEKVRGFSRGDADILYRVTVPAEDRAAAPLRR